ncbi:MAG: alpha/beta hydrolase [Gammaproteobacteria bacterium]
MGWLGAFLVASALGAFALYYVAPGVVFEHAMRLARRIGRLRLRAVTVDAHRLPYLTGGQGEPLLLLHGFGGNKDHWTMIAPHLTRHFRVYAPDLPGFGDATRHDDADYSLDAQLARIAALADALGLARFHLGGSSMGGYLAAHFAARHPERVISLWLLAPAGVLGAPESETMALMGAGDNPLIATDLAALDRLTALCFAVPPSLPAQFKRPLLARARAEAAMNARLFEAVFAAPVALESIAARLPSRLLVVWGDTDRVLHPAALDIMAAVRPDAECLLMLKMGHVPMIERPAHTAADYLRWQGIRV